MPLDKTRKRQLLDELAPVRDAWKARRPTYHREIGRLCRFLIPSGASVLEIGCGTGDLLHAVRPRRGLGIDLSPRMVEIAQGKYPDLEFTVGDVEALDIEEQFDYLLLSDVIGHLDDVWLAFRNLHRVCHPSTRIVVTYYSYLWEPVLRAAERLGLKAPQALQNWLPPQDLTNLAVITGFEPVKRGYCLLCPIQVPLLTPLANRVLAHLPGLRRLDLIHYLVARPEPDPSPPECGVSDHRGDGAALAPGQSSPALPVRCSKAGPSTSGTQCAQRDRCGPEATDSTSLVGLHQGTRFGGDVPIGESARTMERASA